MERSDPVSRVVDEVRKVEQLRTRSAMHRSVNVIREPETELVVRAADCEPGGLLSAGALLSWVEHVRARQWLDTYGVDLVAVQRRWKRTLRATDHQLRWVGMARAFETVRVRTRLTAYDATSTTIETCVLDESARRLKAWVSSRYAWLSTETGEWLEHRPDFLEQLPRIVAGAGLGADPTARIAELERALERSPR